MTSFWSKYTRRQWITIFVFAVADFCSAICVSLQAPFYPQEAEKKGATATEYGLVFGVFELTVFIVSPILGKNLSRFGAKRVFNIGILTTGTCSILFGLLDRIESRAGFIGTSFVVRAIEAVGNSGFLTASFSIIAKEFPEVRNYNLIDELSKLSMTHTNICISECCHDVCIARNLLRYWTHRWTKCRWRTLSGGRIYPTLCSFGSSLDLCGCYDTFCPAVKVRWEGQRHWGRPEERNAGRSQDSSDRPCCVQHSLRFHNDWIYPSHTRASFEAIWTLSCYDG